MLPKAEILEPQDENLGAHTVVNFKSQYSLPVMLIKWLINEDKAVSDKK